jgi:hypothetical protein
MRSGSEELSSGSVTYLAGNDKMRSKTEWILRIDLVLVGGEMTKKMKDLSMGNQNNNHHNYSIYLY